MGSVRGWLTAAPPVLLALLAPGAALAEACDKVRPGWSPGEGPAGHVGEAIYIATSPLGLAVIAIAALSVWLRWRWLAVLIGLATAAFAAALLLGRGAEVAVLAQAEGCIGPAWPGALLLLAMPATALWRAFRR